MHSIVIDQKKKTLTITVSLLDEPEISTSGRFLMIARTPQFLKGDAVYKGLPVSFTCCAGVPTSKLPKAGR